LPEGVCILKNMTWGQNERNKTLEQNDTPVSVPFGDYFSFPESRPASFSATAPAPPPATF
jgi:hypothetical protein